MREGPSIYVSFLIMEEDRGNGGNKSRRTYDQIIFIGLLKYI